MIPERQQKVRELFGDALERPASERIDFVTTASEDDPEVRHEVLRMVEEEARLGSFMGTIPPLEGPDTAPRQSFEVAQVVAARYRIARLIKCGGMGEVYEALDTRLSRRTALKTILPQIAGDASTMERFRREVLLASNVTHKHVCRVYDIGEHVDASGRSVAFLTMEFLPGETLRERLKACGTMAPVVALPLIRQMADALRAAHEAGVIHRDFKPANVMLVPNADGSERAVVTDFGLARSTDTERSAQGLTRSGQVLGTPEYMSPEQWSGRGVGPATDLYALGAVIHEMTLRAAGDLSTEHRQWKTVVDWCLARNPADRPSSAADVVRALESVDSFTPHSQFTGRKLIAATAVVAAVAVFVALFLFGSRFPDGGAVRYRETAAAAISRRIALLPVHSGADSDMFLQGLTDAMTARLGQYGSARYKLFIVPASEVRRERVEDAAAARARFTADYVVEASLQTENQRVRLTLALIEAGPMRQLESAFVEGRLGNALALQDAAVTRIATMLDVDVRPEFAHELNQLSPVVPGAYELYLQARGYLRRNDKPSDVRSAIEVLEKALQRDERYAAGHAALGEAYWRRWERTGDRSWADKAVVQGRRALELQPNRPEAHTAMGIMYSGRGEDALAFQEFEKALQVHPRSIDTHLALGRARARARDFAGAGAAFRKALELEPQDWRAYREMGLMHYEQSNLAGAIEQFQHVIELTPDNPGAYTNLGAFYGQAKNYAKAEEMLTKALQLDPNWLGALTNMGKLLFDHGRYAEAASGWAKAAELDGSSYRLWGNLAAAYARVGRTREARESYSKAIRLLDERIAVNSKDRELHSYRAHFLTGLGKRPEALAALSHYDVAGSNLATLVRDADSCVELGEIGRARTILRMAFKKGYSVEEAMNNDRLRPAMAGWNLKGGKNAEGR